MATRFKFNCSRNLPSTRSWSFLPGRLKKKWVHKNVSSRSVYNGQFQLCMYLLCGVIVPGKVKDMEFTVWARTTVREVYPRWRKFMSKIYMKVVNVFIYHFSQLIRICSFVLTAQTKTLKGTETDVQNWRCIGFSFFTWVLTPDYMELTDVDLYFFSVKILSLQYGGFTVHSARKWRHGCIYI